jgi:hypothetical protein
MASNQLDAQRHLRQWQHNRELLGRLPAECPDWFVTVAFYAVLHVVDALFATDDVDRVRSHGARNDVLLRTNRYQAIKRPYLSLYDLSKRVRYLVDWEGWIRMEQLEADVVKRYVYPIERSAFRLMGQPIPAGDIAVPHGGG